MSPRSSTVAREGGAELVVPRAWGSYFAEYLQAAYERGRMLMIATASLDHQRPIVWNIGLRSFPVGSNSACQLRGR